MAWRRVGRHPMFLALASLVLTACGPVRGADPGGAPVATLRTPTTALATSAPGGPVLEEPPTLFVSPTGDDDASGASPAAALATLQEALERASGGEFIHLLPGTYVETVVFEGRFDPANPVTIAGEAGQTILDGERGLAYALWCEGCAGLVLRDLVFRNYGDACVAVITGASIAFERVEIAECGFAPALSEDFEGYGIYVESSQAVTVIASQAHHNGPNPQQPGFLVGTAVNLYDCTRCVVSGNRIHTNVGAAIVIEDSHDVLAEANEIYDNELDVTAEGWWDGAVWVDGGADIVLRGNTIRGNNGPGLQISDEEGAGASGYVIEANRVLSNRIGLFLWGFGTVGLPGEPVLRFVGNVVEGNDLGDVFVHPDWCLPPSGCG